MVEKAHESGAHTLVFTFFPHPGSVLGTKPIPGYLTSPTERARLLREIGVDEVITFEFSHQFSQLSAGDFVQQLKNQYGLTDLFAGYDFTLGRNREGNVEKLRQLGQELGFQVHLVDAISNGSEILSSRKIRGLIQEGEMALAADFLGRNYRVEGTVIPGDNRGRALGFPTANLDIWSEQLMPPCGVYAGWVSIEGTRHPGVANLGLQPTFQKNNNIPRLEIHLLDFSQDLYGKTIQFEFVQRLRSEIRFDSIDSLKNQIQQDILKTREVLSNGA